MAARYVPRCSGRSCCCSSPWRCIALTVVAIVGHTGSGKSTIAEVVADRFGAEIVSVDSMQVYRGMDIGTAKPSMAVRERIPHHMIDVAEPSQEYDVARFQTEARAAISGIGGRGGRTLIVGGSGLHFRAIVDPASFAPTDPSLREELEATATEDLVAELLLFDPQAGSMVDLYNPRRVTRAVEVARLTGEGPTFRASKPAAVAFRAYQPFMPHHSIGIDAGQHAHARADARFDAMIDSGLVEEVERLAGRLGRTASGAVGYKELEPTVRDVIPLAEGVTDAKRATAH